MSDRLSSVLLGAILIGLLMMAGCGPGAGRDTTVLTTQEATTPTTAKPTVSPTHQVEPSPEPATPTPFNSPTPTFTTTPTPSPLPATSTPTPPSPTPLATPTPTPPFPTPTATSPPAPASATPATLTACCTLPEGVFGAIWNDDALLQAKLGCPTSGHPRIMAAAWEVQTSFQRFERGAMLWSNQIGWYGQPVIFVLHADGTFQRFNDNYAADTDPYSGGETPPRGLMEPALGFGKVWREEPGVRETLGWAISEEAPGAGRFQIFFGGNMIWLSQRQETYVLLDETYTVLESRSFTLPTPAPPGDPSALVLGRWTERDLSGAPLPGMLAFTFLPDGRITFDGCSGRYEFRDGNKITLNTDGCAPPTLPTAIYEYTFEEGGDTLILSQRFQHQMAGFSSARWRQEENDYEIELSGTTIRVIGEACSGLREAQAGCTSLIQWTDCTNGQPPLAAARYIFTYVGNELMMSRQFDRSR